MFIGEKLLTSYFSYQRDAMDAGADESTIESFESKLSIIKADIEKLRYHVIAKIKLQDIKNEISNWEKFNGE